ncbi:NF-X1-type zinc finger protein NFXL2 [Pelomyxa schiedti]|nr:NF-X1-type zinc finger protein NFXL2 [Pelomyxa schiedti]
MHGRGQVRGIRAGSTTVSSRGGLHHSHVSSSCVAAESTVATTSVSTTTTAYGTATTPGIALSNAAQPLVNGAKQSQICPAFESVGPQPQPQPQPQQKRKLNIFISRCVPWPQDQPTPTPPVVAQPVESDHPMESTTREGDAMPHISGFAPQAIPMISTTAPVTPIVTTTTATTTATTTTIPSGKFCSGGTEQSKVVPTEHDNAAVSVKSKTKKQQSRKDHKKEESTEPVKTLKTAEAEVPTSSCQNGDTLKAVDESKPLENKNELKSFVFEEYNKNLALSAPYVSAMTSTSDKKPSAKKRANASTVPSRGSAASNSAARTTECLENLLSVVECVSCRSEVKNEEPTWHCPKCYILMHLDCARTWSKFSAHRPSGLSEEAFPNVESFWKCPMCQALFPMKEAPSYYYCFCGKMKDPVFDPWVLPHSCGAPCGKPLNPPCGHLCSLLCHLGPCQPCPQTVVTRCYCSATKQSRRCSDKVFSCGKRCNKTLSCTHHNCEEICHSGDCPPCKRKVEKTCLCEAVTQLVTCTNKPFQCTKVCGKLLLCGKHNCTKVCHSDVCPKCPLAGTRRCYCGKTSFQLACDIPTPCCSNLCGKVLPCRHSCPEICHPGDCPECAQISEVRCRCGGCKKKTACSSKWKCQNKCSKIRNCGRHPCNKRCCKSCLPCSLICDRALECGNHRCTLICHQGPCTQCPKTATIYCACGKTSVTVPCALKKKTAPPPCDEQCTIALTCHHDIKNAPPHKCHFGPCPSCKQVCGKLHGKCGHVCELPCHDPYPTLPPIPKGQENNIYYRPQLPPPLSLDKVICPPCPKFVQRKCFGEHMEKTVRCSTQPFSCSHNCQNILACGNHKCRQQCHVIKEARALMLPLFPTVGAPAIPTLKITHTNLMGTECDICDKWCEKPRPPGCKHGCPIDKCHLGPCPPCQVLVKVPCHCKGDILYIKCSILLSAESATSALSCGQICSKKLPYCPHICHDICHPSPCKDSQTCSKTVIVRCKCENSRTEKWTCAQAIKVRRASPVVSDSNLYLLECNEQCQKVLLQKKSASLETNQAKGSPASLGTTHHHPTGGKKATVQPTNRKKPFPRWLVVAAIVSSLLLAIAFMLYLL